MKQSAVELLEEKLNEIKSSSTDMNGTIKFLETEFKELFKQSKEMEKKEQLELIQFLSEKEDFKENSSISIFIAEDYLNQFKNK
jgi:hypothetical protein